MKGDLWVARVEVEEAKNLSLENDINWPPSLNDPPETALYENPDSGLFVCEVFLTSKPSETEEKAISQAVGVYLRLPDLKLEFEKVEQKDWVRVSLDYLSPVETNRFFIHGSHDADKIPKGKIPVLIEASLAFGTGHHETTKGCLQALENLAETTTPDRILDLGTGSGILAIGAAKIWQNSKILASDIDPEAIEKAKEFGMLNGEEAINFFVADGFDDDKFQGQKFDLIMANILSGPLIDFAPEIKAHLAEGGHTILAGLLASQRVEVLKAYQNQGLNLVDEIQGQGWPVLTLS